MIETTIKIEKLHEKIYTRERHIKPKRMDSLVKGAETFQQEMQKQVMVARTQREMRKQAKEAIAREERRIKPERMDHIEKGACIGKPKEASK